MAVQSLLDAHVVIPANPKVRHHLQNAFTMLARYESAPVYHVRLDDVDYAHVLEIVTDFVGQPGAVIRDKAALWHVPTAARYIHVTKEYRHTLVTVYRAGALAKWLDDTALREDCKQAFFELVVERPACPDCLRDNGTHDVSCPQVATP